MKVTRLALTYNGEDFILFDNLHPWIAKWMARETRNLEKLRDPHDMSVVITAPDDWFPTSKKEF